MKKKKLSKKEIKKRFYASLETAKETYGLNGVSAKPFQTSSNSLDNLDPLEECLDAYSGLDEEDVFKERINSLVAFFEGENYSSAIQEAKEIKKFISNQEKDLGRCVVDNINKSFSGVQDMIREYRKLKSN